MKIVLATNNPGKLKEMQQLFAQLPVTLHSQAEFELPSVAETGTTFIENALIKARHVSEATELPAIADDSGLVVPQLGGQPGIYSARYASDQVEGQPSDTDNNNKLIHTLDATGAFSDIVPAYFYCTMAFVRHPQDPTPLIAHGKWQGQILQHPRGQNGFGYDPYFFVADMNATSAELPAEVKNRHSHRAHASAHLLSLLDSEAEFN